MVGRGATFSVVCPQWMVSRPCEPSGSVTTTRAGTRSTPGCGVDVDRFGANADQQHVGLDELGRGHVERAAAERDGAVSPFWTTSASRKFIGGVPMNPCEVTG